MIDFVRSDADLARCFPVMRELRPHLQDEAHLLRLSHTMRAEGVEFAALEHDGEITTVTAFRVRTMLASGLTMYVDDLVTGERFRSQGHGKAMLTWLVDLARQRGCKTFSLDSGTFRHDAHAFYFREGLRVTSFHFARSL